MIIKKKRVFVILLTAFCTVPLLIAQNIDDEPFWQQAIGGVVIGPPLPQAESVVMVTDGGNIKAYNWEGKALWDYFARGRLQPFISRSIEGATYVCRTNGILIAVNRSGREIWRKNLREPLTAPVMIGWDSRIFVFTAKHIYCYTASGFSLWSRSLEKAIALKPHHDGQGGFLLVLEDGELLRVNAFGQVSRDQLRAIPLAGIPVEVMEEHRLLFIYPSGVMELFDTGKGEWETLKINLGAAPVAAAGRGSHAAVLLHDGRIAYLSLNDRELLWTGETHVSYISVDRANSTGENLIEATFFIDERGVYFLTKDGAAGFAEDGKRLWLIRLQGTTSLPAFSGEGILYSGGEDWILYAYKMEEQAPVRKSPLYSPAPPGIYGTGIPQPDFWAKYPHRYREEVMKPWFTEIERAIREGQVGENEKEYASWLIEIAGSFLIYAHLQNSWPELHHPVFVRYRTQALRLLAYIGSRETVPFLVDVFVREKEPLVKAAVAETLALIGVDPGGIALKAFTSALYPPTSLRDEHALTAIAAATGAICRFSGPPLSDTGLHILTILGTYSMPPAARFRAQQELQTLQPHLSIVK